MQDALVHAKTWGAVNSTKELVQDEHDFGPGQPGQSVHGVRQHAHREERNGDADRHERDVLDLEPTSGRSRTTSS